MFVGGVIQLSIPHILKHLEESIEIESKARAAEPREFHHNPSSASFKVGAETYGACLRRLYYRASETPVTNTSGFSSKLTAKFGQSIHDWIFTTLKGHEHLHVESEVPGKVLVNPLTKEISYRMDGLLTHKGERGGVEVKTKGGYKLQSMVKSHGPDWADFAQIVTYFEIERELMWYVLVYVARDTGFHAEYHIYRDYNDGEKIKYRGIVPQETHPKELPVTFQQVKDRWQLLEKYIVDKVVPPRDYKVALDKEGKPTKERTRNYVKIKSDVNCMYCPWLNHCWSQPGAKEDASIS